MKKVALIIPVYNSAGILPNTFLRLNNFFADRDYIEEVVFVDDGSIDISKNLIEEFIKNSHLNVRLMSHKQNLGKGESVKNGILSVSDSTDFIFFSDDDLPFGLEPFDEIFQKLEGDDSLGIVIGDRTLIMQNNPYQLHHKIGSFIYGMLLPRAIRKRFPDVHAGIRGYRTSVAKQIFGFIKNSRWSFDPEIFIIAVNNNFIVDKVMVQYLGHVEGTDFKINDYLNVIKELIKLRINSYFGKYKMK